jgi:hypothetical protein
MLFANLNLFAAARRFACQKLAALLMLLRLLLMSTRARKSRRCNALVCKAAALKKQPIDFGPAGPAAARLPHIMLLGHRFGRRRKIA